MTAAALQVVDLHARSAQAPVLNGVSLYAMAGEIIALFGRNDSGRSAILQAIVGHAKTRKGSVRVIGRETIHQHSDDVRHLGLGFLSTHGNIFPHLTCEENLLLPTSNSDTLGGAMSLSQIYELCPDLNTLRHTLGTRLSRAEKRMLAIARLLRTGANVLLMDNIADDLAPVMTQALSAMIRNLKYLDYTIIMSEHDIEFCAGLADRFYIVENGQIIDSFDQTVLPARRCKLQALLAHGHYDTH